MNIWVETTQTKSHKTLFMATNQVFNNLSLETVLKNQTIPNPLPLANSLNNPSGLFQDKVNLKPLRVQV